MKSNPSTFTWQSPIRRRLPRFVTTRTEKQVEILSDQIAAVKEIESHDVD
jgi:hypothetical protein